MRFSVRPAALLLAIPLAWPAPIGAALPAAVGPSETNRALVRHVVSRLTFGARPGDLERVERLGVPAFIQEQLHPEKLDDSATDALVNELELVKLSGTELHKLYLDERERAKAKRMEKQARINAAEGLGAPAMVAPALPPVTADPAAPQPWPSAAVIAQLEQAKLIRAVDSERQLQEVLVDFWTNHFNIDMKKGPCRVSKVADDREVIRAHLWGRFRDLLGASAKSPAMLFYLDNAGNSVGRTVTVQQQQRLAQFQKKRLAAVSTEAEPAMLEPPLQPKQVGGINENYARELMELHTIGIDGGYTQKDVQEVARCFTGWTIDPPTGTFRFAPRRHDSGQKRVLGQVIPAGGGEQDGETVLDLLCARPACARFVSRKLCQRFVADEPPDALVERVAAVFTRTGGDLRQVVEAILLSPEFLSPASFETKIKSPLEFAVSAVRASQSLLVPKDPPPLDRRRAAFEGAGVLGRGQATDRLSQAKRQSLKWHLLELGEPLFACTPPTGYKEDSRTWVSSGALIERLNFALALTQQEVSDVHFDAQALVRGADLDQPKAVLEQCVALLLQDRLTPGTRAVLEKAALPAEASHTVDPAKLIALILGSPEFQRK